MWLVGKAKEVLDLISQGKKSIFSLFCRSLSEKIYEVSYTFLQHFSLANFVLGATLLEHSKFKSSFTNLK